MADTQNDTSELDGVFVALVPRMYPWEEELKQALATLIAQREQAARVDELKRLKSLHSQTYTQTITDNSGGIYVDESHYISSYALQERIAELEKTTKPEKEG